MTAHPELTPSSFVKEGVPVAWKHDYMFMAAVDFIKSVSSVNKQHCGLGRPGGLHEY